MYCDKTLKEYLNDLAAKLPAPGGGSASALVASCGAALISMVINFTLGKPKYAAYEIELKSLLESSVRLKDEFLDLVDKDVAAYQSRDIRDAVNVPFMVCRLCFEAIKLCPPLVKKGNARLISDVAVAVALLESAFTSAYYNVKINLKSLDDKKLSLSIFKELSRKDRLIKNVRLKTEEKIGKIIGG